MTRVRWSARRALRAADTAPGHAADTVASTRRAGRRVSHRLTGRRAGSTRERSGATRRRSARLPRHAGHALRRRIADSAGVTRRSWSLGALALTARHTAGAAHRAALTHRARAARLPTHARATLPRRRTHGAGVAARARVDEARGLAHRAPGRARDGSCGTRRPRSARRSRVAPGAHACTITEAATTGRARGEDARGDAHRASARAVGGAAQTWVDQRARRAGVAAGALADAAEPRRAHRPIGDSASSHAVRHARRALGHAVLTRVGERARDARLTRRHAEPVLAASARGTPHADAERVDALVGATDGSGGARRGATGDRLAEPLEARLPGGTRHADARPLRAAVIEAGVGIGAVEVDTVSCEAGASTAHLARGTRTAARATVGVVELQVGAHRLAGRQPTIAPCRSRHRSGRHLRACSQNQGTEEACDSSGAEHDATQSRPDAPGLLASLVSLIRDADAVAR